MPVISSSIPNLRFMVALVGYLTPLPREKGDVARYRFVRDTGAKAPQILSVKQLFDANTGEIVVGQDIQSALDDAEGASC